MNDADISAPGLRSWLQRLDAPLRYESHVLEEAYEAWRRGQTELHQAYQQLKDERKLLKDTEQDLSEQRKKFEEHASRHWPRTSSDHKYAGGSKHDKKSKKTSKHRVSLNVGGHRFETVSTVLTKDRFSMLAAIADNFEAFSSEDPSARGGMSVFIDRDWWIFRHILAFLRHESLPDNTGLLRQLYIESAYYRLFTMRDAIEAKLEQFDPKTVNNVLDLQRSASAPLRQYQQIGHEQNYSSETDAKSQSIRSAAQQALRWATSGSDLGGPRPSGEQQISQLPFTDRLDDELEFAFDRDANALRALEYEFGSSRRSALRTLEGLQLSDKRRSKQNRKNEHDGYGSSETLVDYASTRRSQRAILDIWASSSRPSSLRESTNWYERARLNPHTLSALPQGTPVELLSPDRDAERRKERVRASRPATPESEVSSTQVHVGYASNPTVQPLPLPDDQMKAEFEDFALKRSSHKSSYHLSEDDLRRKAEATRLPDPFGFTPSNK